MGETYYRKGGPTGPATAADDTTNIFPVTVVSSAVAGTQYTEDAASAGAEKLTLAGVIRRDTPAGDTSADGDYATLVVDNLNRLWVRLASSVTEDAASVGGESAVLIAGVRKDAGGTNVSTDGDYGTLLFDANGNLYVKADTEFAAAIAAAESMANPTVPQVLAHKMHWNGTSWDRSKGGTAGGAVGYPATTLVTSGSISADATATTPAQYMDSAGAGRLLGMAGMLFNGTNYDRPRNNVEGTALASAARTATTSSADIVNYNGKGILIIFNATAFAATPTLTVSVDAKDPVSGNYVPLTTFTALNIAGATTQAYTLYPGAAETAATANHEVQALALPRTFRITVTAGDADSCTYSVGYTILL